MKIPTKEFYINHLHKFAQYSNSKKWNLWYVNVAKHKGLRTVKILSEYKNSNSKLLDLGCGIGLTLSLLAQKFTNSFGCDIDKRALKATKEILDEVGIKIPLVVYNGGKLPFRDNTFDIVTFIEVIEHVQNPDQVLKEVQRVLKKDGILHITTANKWWPHEPHFKLFFLSYLPERWADLYVRLSGKGKSYHGIKLPSYGNFKRLIEKHFFVEDITLDMIENYRKYNFDKERGLKVVIVGEFLKFLRKIENVPLLNNLALVIRWLLLRVSLGWLFIGRPKKEL